MNLIGKQYLKYWFIYLVPIAYLAWYLFRIHLIGPFYLSRIDPDYVYLLNGLNCAILDFDRIGHVQHPGTPLQIITGVFIRITHLFAGHGNIIDDVIKNPEIYLSWCSFYIALITMGILIWLGKISYKATNSFVGTLIIQCSLFFTLYPLDLTTSYNPDRVLPLYVLILAGLCIQLLYNKQFTEKRFAILSGILFGFAVITKIHFLPLIIIPLILIHRFSSLCYFGISFIVAGVISYLPVHKKLMSSLTFFSQMIKHDGLYGKGAEQFIDPQKFLENIVTLVQNNWTTTILYILCLVTIIYLIFRSPVRKEKKQEFLILIAFILSDLVGLILVSKHYKPSYFVPYISLNALILFILWKVFYKDLPKIGKVLFLCLSLTLLLLPLKKLWYSNHYQNNVAKTSSYEARLIQDQITSNDFLLIEPTWRSGPFVENGLIYGNCFVAHYYQYYNNYARIYPNILTYDGENSSLKYFIMVEADNEAIFKSGKNIFVLSTPKRNAPLIDNYLNGYADSLGIKLQKDTCYANTKDNVYLIKYRNVSGWGIKSTATCGFERNETNALFTDDGRVPLTGNYRLDRGNKCNGCYSLKLDSNLNISPSFTVHGVAKGDYIVFTVKSSTKTDSDKKDGSLVIKTAWIDADSIARTTQFQSLNITPGWYLTRLSVEIMDQPVDSSLSCYFEFSGNEVEYIDDFAYEHYQCR